MCYLVGIYKITNNINGKCYIGQSIHLEKRIAEHKAVAFNKNKANYHYPIYQAIRKYGIENFTFEVLEECKIDELNDKEVFYIKFYNAYSNGYNQNEGGNFSPHQQKLSKEDVESIINLLKTSHQTMQSIAAQFNVQVRAISKINNGHTWRNDNETYPIRTKNALVPYRQIRPIQSKAQYLCPFCGTSIERRSKCCVTCSHNMQRVVQRPDKHRLMQLIANSSFVNVGKMFGVSNKAIVKWCAAYGLPTKIKDLKQLYQSTLGE